MEENRQGQEEMDRANAEARREIKRTALIRIGIALLTAFAGVVVAVSSFSSLFFEKVKPGTPPGKFVELDFGPMVQQSIKPLEARLVSVEQMFKNPRPEAALSLQVTQLEAGFENLQGRLDRFEKAVIADPARAIELPLLRRDLEHLRSIQDAGMVAMKESIDRTFTMLITFMGIIGASIVGLAIANIFTPKVPATEKPRAK